MNKRLAYDEIINNQKRTDPSEMGRAIYFASNPRELSELWYMVGDQNGDNFLLKTAHAIIPCSVADNTIPLLRKLYGEIVELGYTWDLEPYHIGAKRMSAEDRHDLENAIREGCTKAGYILQLQAQINDDNKEEIEMLIEQIPEIDDKVFDEIIAKDIPYKIASLIYETSEEDAKQQAAEFYFMDAKREMEVKQESIEHTLVGIAYARQLHP